MSELYIGTLSGTSVDGIDAALVRFGPHPELLASHFAPFPAGLREEILHLCMPGENEIDRLGQTDVRLGQAFAQAVRELLEKTAFTARDIRAIGSHGQTIRHRPGRTPGFTLQIGDPNIISAVTGIPVVADFRRKDMALGGQGAPLVPAFHQAVFHAAGTDRVIVNIGGIANLTVLPGSAGLNGGTRPPDGLAPCAQEKTRPEAAFHPNHLHRYGFVGFDTGPGNTLLDAWCRQVLGEPMDRDGQLAAQGRVRPDLLGAMLGDPYFQLAAPKSTGPEYFSMAWLQRHLAGIGPGAEADVQATLVALTAQSIAAAIHQLVGLKQPDVYVCGGGAHNPALMGALTERLNGSKVDRTDALGIPADWVEAMAFAWLAQQRLHGAAGNCPGVTGASRPAVLGGLWLPE